ncbi:MAG: DUF1800 domain-containing protein [Planctomycetota bacterium]|jgi:uncharacterized protein (DUF1800 family)
MHAALEPWRPSRHDPWDFDAAAHLWRRAGFGAPPRTVAATLRKSATEAVASVVDGPARDAAAAELESIYESVLGTGSADTVRAWLITRMARCDHQLREKLALFWHGHFATSILKVRDVPWMMRQYRLFLDHGLGRFATLLDAVTRDPAMIRWLDNETNRKGHANENYARELFELFTLGEGNYTEKDIQEAARAFTGWHILHDRFHFSRTLHDDGEKTVLGRTGRFGGADICRLALEQEACCRLLARKLLVFFVHPQPSAEVIAAFGRLIRHLDYDLKAALRRLFASRLFFDRANRRALIKSPLEFVVGAVRALDLKLDAEAAVPVLRAMGQDLLAPPNVKGWPGHTDWINTATWLTRVDAARRLVGGFDGGRDLDACARALLGRPLPEPERNRFSRNGAGRRDLVHALLSLPEAHLA